MMYQGEDQMTTPATKTSFNFRRRYVQIDWRSLGQTNALVYNYWS